MKALLLVLAFLPGLAVASTRPPTDEEKLVIERAVQHSLKDPGSMQLQDLRVGPGKTEGSLTVCGQVNAKNSFGGYVGFRTFYAMYVLKNKNGDPAAIVIGVDDGRTNVASSFCTRDGL